jgi:DNA-binding response OmpR family regulator
MHPDLIVLDIMLPKISGVELLQIIRTSAGVNEIPVLVFTNSFQDDVLERVRQLGADRIMSKSRFVPREVVAVIHQVLNGSDGSVVTLAEPLTNKTATEAFRKQLADQLASCRQFAVEIVRRTAPDVRVPHIRNLRTGVRHLTGSASAVGLKSQAYFCEAFEAFLNELCEQPARINVSSVRTISQGVDFLFDGFDLTRTLQSPDDLKFRVLLVDDDPISRRAVQVALGRIKQQALECGTSTEALQLAAERTFDLIFVDMDMPELSGAELCAQFRSSQTNRVTPVIFVTGHTDLQTRAQSTLSGGNDFIGKPFHFMELAVKTLLHLLRSRLK